MNSSLPTVSIPKKHNSLLSFFWMSKGYKTRMILVKYLRLLIFQLCFYGIIMFELEKEFRDAALYLRKRKVRAIVWPGKVTMYVSGRADPKTQIDLCVSVSHYTGSSWLFIWGPEWTSANNSECCRNDGTSWPPWLHPSLTSSTHCLDLLSHLLGLASQSVMHKIHHCTVIRLTYTWAIRPFKVVTSKD